MSKNASTTAFFKVIREDIIIPDHNPPVSLDPKVLSKNKRSLILILAISLGPISCFCFIFAIFSFFRYRHQDCRYRKLLGKANLRLAEELTLQRSFSYNELEKASDGFKGGIIWICL